ncbi:hypothetical protein [Myroides guanonis]|uniref:DUF4377 domain-containing protein n=1 Tax=Myroides guanonis TaxID=1150112 RepID=A0A1I3PE42_9FLAO|nr:hypothetical protein [Myroides guanonis]SFJ19743.1 hypothetical protein SAMN04487893_10487 [Myroides guanonis]
MKKLIFTLVGVCTLGLSSFASTTTTNDQFPPGNWGIPEYPYELVVMKPIKIEGSNYHGYQFVVREKGCGTDSYVNNRLQQLRNQYAGPGVIIMNEVLTIVGEPRVSCNGVIVYPIPFPGDVILEPIKVKP